MATESPIASATRDVVVDAAKHGAVPGTVLALLGLMLNSQITDMRGEILTRLDRTEDRVNDMGRELAKITERTVARDRELAEIQARVSNVEAMIMGAYYPPTPRVPTPAYPGRPAARYEERASERAPDAAPRGQPTP